MLNSAKVREIYSKYGVVFSVGQENFGNGKLGDIIVYFNKIHSRKNIPDTFEGRKVRWELIGKVEIKMSKDGGI